MPWSSLAERFNDLPLILAGPILRRTEPGSVSVWVALKEPRLVTLRVLASGRDGRLVRCLTGTRATIRLGDHLHIAVATATCAPRDNPLTSGRLYYYNLYFAVAVEADGHVSEDGENLTSAGILQTGVAASAATNGLARLTYPDHPLPSFALPPQDLSQLRIFHGSCRKPHGDGQDALAALDLAIAESVEAPDRRPHQLFLTGDQIYADDVALPLLLALTDAGDLLFSGNQEEFLPLVNLPARALAPGKRGRAVRGLAAFTTGEPHSHLLTRAEYAAMYLFAWSDVLWPTDLPTVDDLRALYPPLQNTLSEELPNEADQFESQLRQLLTFRAALPYVRRALANIPCYMICDDHDVTDDWYLDGAWCATVLSSSLGRRVVRNALFAYALFQAWGNDPAQFAQTDGAAFLAAVDAWHGNESDSLAHALESHLGLPESFDGVGELAHPRWALHWHYTVDGPGYRVFVLDTRTHRVYEAPHAPPGLLSPEAMSIQFDAQPSAVNLVVSATPVLGVSIVERFQSMDQIRQDDYTYDREAWALDRDAHQHLLNALGQMPHVVILSGDVHYGFGAVLQYWNNTVPEAVSGTIVDFTSSSLRNPTDGVHKALLTIAYPRLFEMLHHGRLPAIEFFVWDTPSGEREALHDVFAALRSRWSHIVWAVPRLVEVMSAPTTLILPAHGWPAGSFDKYPPDHRQRLFYLRDELAEGPSPSSATPMEVITAGAAEPVRAAGISNSISNGVPDGVPDGDADVQTRLTWRQRLMLALHGTVAVGQSGSVPQQESREDHYPDKLLAEAVRRKDLWADQWSGSTNIIGDTNLGEVRFDWERKETIQRLWWWRPGGGDRPTPATVYRASLEPPNLADAPPLP